MHGSEAANTSGGRGSSKLSQYGENVEDIN